MKKVAVATFIQPDVLALAVDVNTFLNTITAERFISVEYVSSAGPLFSAMVVYYVN